MASLNGQLSFKSLASLSHTTNKAAILGMTRQLAMEGSAHGIRVNSISPGLIVSGANRARLNEGEGGFAREMVERTLLGRLGDPEDVANLAHLRPASQLRTLRRLRSLVGNHNVDVGN